MTINYNERQKNKPLDEWLEEQKELEEKKNGKRNKNK